MERWHPKGVWNPKQDLKFSPPQDHEVFSGVGVLLLTQSLLNHCPLLMGNNWEGCTSWALPTVWVVTSLFGMAGPSLGWWQVSGSKLLLLPAWPHQIAVVFGDSCYSHPVAAHTLPFTSSVGVRTSLMELKLQNSWTFRRKWRGGLPTGSSICWGGVRLFLPEAKDALHGPVKKE